MKAKEYSAELADKIIETLLVELNEDFLGSSKFPGKTKLKKWLEEHSDFKERYTKTINDIQAYRPDVAKEVYDQVASGKMWVNGFKYPNTELIWKWRRDVPEFDDMMEEAMRFHNKAQEIERVRKYNEKVNAKRNGTYKYETGIGHTDDDADPKIYTYDVFDPNDFTIIKDRDMGDSWASIYIDKKKLTHISWQRKNEILGPGNFNYYLVDIEFHFVGGGILKQDDLLIDEEWCVDGYAFQFGETRD